MFHSLLLKMRPKSARHIELECTVTEMGKDCLHMLQYANVVVVASGTTIVVQIGCY